VRIISETLASLPLILYRRLPEGGKERATDHPLYALLHDRPNSEQTAMCFREEKQAHVLLHGNTYSFMERGRGTGRVRNLWPLNPENMDKRRVSGEIFYEYDDNGQKKVLGAGEVLHIPGLGFDGIKGYSVIHVFKQLFSASRASERMGAELFKNFGQPKGIIRLKGRLADRAARDRLRESWESAQADWGNKHRVAVLEDDAEWQSLSIPPDDAQFLETRKFQVNEIARMFRVPPHLIGDLDRATFNNIEHQGIEFVVHTMRPWLVRWEQALNRQLLTERDQREYFFEFKIDALLRGDAKARWEAYRTAREIGVLSANDIREMENMNPIDGGDKYFVPMNWIPADMAEEVAMPQEPPPMEEEEEQNSFREQRALRVATGRANIAEAFQPMFADGVRRLLSKERRELQKGIDRHLTARALEDFELYLDEVYREMPEYIRRTMAPIYTSLASSVKGAVAEELGIDSEMSPKNEDFVRAFVTVYVERYVAHSRSDIRKALDRAAENGEFAEELSATMDHWAETRAGDEARNEAVRGSNAFARQSYLLAGVLRLRWVALGSKTCPYCASMDGTIVDIQQDFAMSGDVLEEHTGEMEIQSKVGHPPLHRGCVCQIIAA
jgi:HK97 family phage portal protein